MKKIIIKLQGKNMSIHKSSCFHGWMMEQIEGEYATFLHEEQMRPFSQFLRKIDDEQWEWQISLLNTEAERRIGAILLNESIKEILLEGQQETIEILEKTVMEENIDDLLKKTYFQDSSRFCTVRFLTTTSFKRQGQFMIFPEVKLIFQSILSRYHANDYDVEIGGDELLEQIEKNVSIVDYQLRTSYFCLESSRIKGFQGRATLKINGPQMFVNLVHMLLEYGSYCGVGVKTALGMGAMEVERR